MRHYLIVDDNRAFAENLGDIPVHNLNNVIRSLEARAAVPSVAR